jgi:hypothetical protein
MRFTAAQVGHQVAKSLIQFNFSIMETSEMFDDSFECFH